MRMKPNYPKLALVVIALALLAAVAGCDSNQDKVELPKGAATAAAPEDADKSQDAAKELKAEQANREGASGAASSSGTVQLEAATSGRKFSGSFEAPRNTDVAASVPGLVREVYVVEGQTVEKGDKLIDIDGQNYALQVAQAEAAVEAAKAQVDTLEIEFNRVTKLTEQEAVASSQLDQLTGQLAAARAQLQQAEVGVRLARKSRSDAMIRAPYTGVVTMVSAAAGDYAAPGAMPLAQLAEVQKLYLRVNIPEQYSGIIEAGDMLQARVPALNKTMKFEVTRVNPVIQDHTRAFSAIAEVDNPELEIRAGMFAEVQLLDASKDQPDEAEEGTP